MYTLNNNNISIVFYFMKILLILFLRLKCCFSVPNKTMNYLENIITLYYSS